MGSGIPKLILYGSRDVCTTNSTGDSISYALSTWGKYYIITVLKDTGQTQHNWMNAADSVVVLF